MTLYQLLALIILAAIVTAAVVLGTACKVCGTHKCLTKEECEKVRKGEL